MSRDRPKRLTFADLVEEVRRILEDPVACKKTIGEVADELGTSAQRIVDALDAIEMLGLTDRLSVRS